MTDKEKDNFTAEWQKLIYFEWDEANIRKALELIEFYKNEFNGSVAK